MTKAERKAIEELLDLSKDNLTEKFHAAVLDEHDNEKQFVQLLYQH